MARALKPPLVTSGLAGLVALFGVLTPAGAVAAGSAPCPALSNGARPMPIAVLLERDPAPSSSAALDQQVWDALKAALEAMPLPAGVRLEVGEGQPAPSQPWVKVQGGLIQVGSLTLFGISISFDPADGRPDLAVEVQDRTLAAATSREWLALPATLIDEAGLTEPRPPGEGAHAVAAYEPIAFLRGLVAYLAHRRLPPPCTSEAEKLKALAISSLRRWDGPRQEEVAAEASALAKQLRAFLQFDDDGCTAYDGGEDPARLLIAAARLSPHRSESRRLAVIAQLHQAYQPARLCGVTVERDVLASLAIAPADEAALRDAGLAYDLLAQGPPRAFAPGQEVDRIEAFQQMRRVPRDQRPAVRGTLEVGAGALLSLGSSGAAPGGRIEVWLGPTVVPLAVRAAAEFTSSRNIGFPNGASSSSRASWRRDSASLGLGYRLGIHGLFVNLFADGSIARAHVDGHDFSTDRNTTSLDAGGGVGVRAGWSWRSIAVSAEVAEQVWAISQSAEVNGIAQQYLLPRSDLSVALLISLSNRISVR